MSAGDSKDLLNLNLVDCQMRLHWDRLNEEVLSMQSILNSNPDLKGLKLARSKMYNVIADIQLLTDMLDT